MDLRTRLNACMSTGELHSALVDATSALAAILSITSVCGKEPGQMLCVIDFIPGPTNAGILAARLDGTVFARNSVAINLTLSPDFICDKGFPISKRPCSCAIRDDAEHTNQTLV